MLIPHQIYDDTSFALIPDILEMSPSVFYQILILTTELKYRPSGKGHGFLVQLYQAYFGSSCQIILNILDS